MPQKLAEQKTIEQKANKKKKSEKVSKKASKKAPKDDEFEFPKDDDP